jgi:hypothetical protein
MYWEFHRLKFCTMKPKNGFQEEGISVGLCFRVSIFLRGYGVGRALRFRRRDCSDRKPALGHGDNFGIYSRRRHFVVVCGRRPALIGRRAQGT